jgi:hypothetical protein
MMPKGTTGLERVKKTGQTKQLNLTIITAAWETKSNIYYNRYKLCIAVISISLLVGWIPNKLTA